MDNTQELVADFFTHFSPAEADELLFEMLNDAMVSDNADRQTRGSMLILYRKLVPLIAQLHADTKAPTASGA